MRYIAPLFLLVACVATTAHSMDEQKALTLKRQCATINWLQNADPKTVKLIGADELCPSQVHTTQLVQAFLTTLDAPCFEFTSKESITPIVCLDVKKLTPLFHVMEQLRKAEELMAELIKKYKEAQAEYLPLNALMNLFPMEYRTSENESRRDALQQNIEQFGSQLASCDPNWRTRYNCPKLSDRASKQPTMQEIDAKKRAFARKFPAPGFSFPF